MARHRAVPPPRRHSAPAGRRRAEQVRPRWGRLAVLGASVSVTAVAMLGGIGILPSGGGDAAAGPAVQRSSSPAVSSSSSSAPVAPAPETATEVPADDLADVDARRIDPPVPMNSGHGRRIVFDQGDQRVWLVDEDEKVERSYLVSGSIYDNLDPGTYSVFSRSQYAVGVDDSGTMEYFVRFTHGPNGAAIGFHDIPIDQGKLVQTAAQLGTPESHGCIRQLRKDAIALWDFAPIGTEVDVTA